MLAQAAVLPFVDSLRLPEEYTLTNVRLQYPLSAWAQAQPPPCTPIRQAL